MTEVMSTLQPGAGTRRPGSIGKPFGDVRIRLEDPEGREVAVGEVGESVAVHDVSRCPRRCAAPAATRQGPCAPGMLRPEQRFDIAHSAEQAIRRVGQRQKPGMQIEGTRFLIDSSGLEVRSSEVGAAVAGARDASSTPPAPIPRLFPVAGRGPPARGVCLAVWPTCDRASLASCTL